MLCGLSADVNMLYAGLFISNHIAHLCIESLNITKTALLKSPHVTKETKLLDL